MNKYKPLIDVMRSIYGDGAIPLHRPIFEGHERQSMIDCIDSNFVSSVGKKVTEFEGRVAAYMGASHAVAVVSGTAGLQIALQLAGVKEGEEVITQALTFVATCNAIRYAGAWPVFVDVDRESLGLSPQNLRDFLETECETRPGGTFNRRSGRRVSACLPMHTFGIPCRLSEIKSICDEWSVPLVEDAAESLGSQIEMSAGSWQHCGTVGLLSTLSFNGNKIITTGGGGGILTNDSALAMRAKHLTTTAKVPHAFEYTHDELGYNYRLPNLNAALGCAQMERLPEMLEIKAGIAVRYAQVLGQSEIKFVGSPTGTRPNNWLNAIILDSRGERDQFLEYTNSLGIMTRPIWSLINTLPMYVDCQHDGLSNSVWLEDRVVNLPSSVPDGALQECE